MALYEIDWNPSDSYLRLFATTLLAFSAAVASWLHWRCNLMVPAGVLLAIGSATSLVGWLRPAAVRPLYRIWMTLAFPCGWLLSHAMMAGLYFLVLTPMAIALRGTGYDPVQRRFPGERDSYWEPRPETKDWRQYFRQY